MQFGASADVVALTDYDTSSTGLWRRFDKIEKFPLHKLYVYMNIECDYCYVRIKKFIFIWIEWNARCFEPFSGHIQIVGYKVQQRYRK